MLIWGVNESAHDAAISVVGDGEILFAAHAERYSKTKNDWFLNKQLVDEALSFGEPDEIAYYEKRWLKRVRLITKGGKASTLTSIDHIGKQREFHHHFSHACAGYYTSRFDDALIVVIDAIGEFATTTVWQGHGASIHKLHQQNYPFSFGLFYSAFTQLVGLEPNRDEYILMGMAAHGDPYRYLGKVSQYFPNINKQKYNFHKGITDWGETVSASNKFDIAAAVQAVYSLRLVEFMNFAKTLTKSNNLVFMGGCALNCSANTLLWNLFDDIWIMPNPGDAGSSLGAALAIHKKHVKFVNTYLGHDMGSQYPVNNILLQLISKKVAAVASGRAEFGPRALGNRSILADPRDANIKNIVNEIKAREQFRPFAPVVLEQYAKDWFDMPCNSSPYMQYSFTCKKPHLVPSVVHRDGTSRIQTVNKDQHPGLFETLTKWHELTGIPMLLNTSLNIKNQPLLNDSSDVAKWESTYNFSICV